MQLEFTKMHGAGNDVIVFDAPRDGVLPTVEQWRALSDRHLHRKNAAGRKSAREVRK